MNNQKFCVIWYWNDEVNAIIGPYDIETDARNVMKRLKEEKGSRYEVRVMGKITPILD